MSKKTDKILGRKPGRKQTLNLKRAAILGKPMPKTDEEERGEDGKWTSGGGGSKGESKRPTSEMEPGKEKAFAKAAAKLVANKGEGKPGEFDEHHGGHGTDPDSWVDSAGSDYVPPPPQGTAKASKPTSPPGPAAAPDPNTPPQPFVETDDDADADRATQKKNAILGRRKDWDESKHPRDKGKFSSGGGGGDLAGQGAGAKELHGMAEAAKARIASRAAKSKQERGKLVGAANEAIHGAEGASSKAHAALAELRNRVGIHPAMAGKAAKAAEEHAAVLKEAAAHTKDPAHAQIAAKAEMHAKAARESAQKATKAATPVAAAHHAANAKVSAGKAEGLREHMTREIGKKADKEEREGRAPKKAPGGEGGGGEGGDGEQPQGHHLLPLREVWQMLIGK